MENRIKSLIKKLSKHGYHVKSKNNDHVDLVCGMKVSNDLLKTDYLGESYFFCSDHCKKQFDKKPEAYI